MDDERLTKRRAYEAAKTYHRAYRERFYPLTTLGGRAAEQVTNEARAEITRLEEAVETARLAWEATRQPIAAEASTPGPAAFDQSG